MIRLRPLTQRQAGPLLLGACAALLVSLPPANVAGKLDIRLFDFWSRVTETTAPDDIVLVDLDDPAWLSVLADRVYEDRSRLLVSTLSDPPSSRVNEIALGPTEIAIGDQLLKRTDWRHGGHISFMPDADGRVRSLPPYLLNDDTMPSLAVAVHELLHPDDHILDESARLSFSSPESFARFTPEELKRTPGALSDRIVVAGRAESRHETPVGPLADHELLAQIISAYRTDSLIGTHPVAAFVPWLIVMLAICFAAVRQRQQIGRGWILPTIGALALVGVSGLGFFVFSVSVPIASPAVMLVATGSLLSIRPARVHPQESTNRRMTDIAAHDALAEGRIEEAWEHIEAIPATQVNLESLYEFAVALEQQGYPDLAADSYHRAALIDPRYRDVAQRLVRATRGDGEHANLDHLLEDSGIPRQLGRYELLEPIGRGSTGTVYLAIDPSISRLVALKVINLKADYDADSLGEARERFWREAESAGRLSHPNIVTIFDIGESAGVAYIAMEYLKGRHLSDFTSAETLLPAALVLELGAQTAEALAYAHAHNVVHRDIKPGNIMYDSVSGALSITDFGIARLMDVSRTRTGVVLGTPSFMAPEQLEGKNVNRHTDLFALGVSLYELLTGRLPFLGASMTKLMFVIANEPHQPITAVKPDLPVSLDSFMDVALAKCPEDRFSTGVQMAAALRRIAAEVA